MGLVRHSAFWAAYPGPGWLGFILMSDESKVMTAYGCILIEALFWSLK